MKQYIDELTDDELAQQIELQQDRIETLSEMMEDYDSDFAGMPALQSQLLSYKQTLSQLRVELTKRD